MSRSRRALIIPRALTVTVVLAAACSSGPGPDSGTDVATRDVSDAVADTVIDDLFTDALADAVTDVAPCDVHPFDPNTFQCLIDPHAGPDANADCRDQVVCTATMCPTSCVACPTGPFGTAGYLCLPSPHADVAAACPTSRVCLASDCPTGCDACAEAFYCIPDTNADVAMGQCHPGNVCNPADCPIGCRSVG